MPSRARVLVVEHDPEVRNAVRVALTLGGYEVMEAENAESAIEVVKCCACPPKIDVIICDVYMPMIHGMEGTSYLRLHFPCAPLIVLTGYLDIEYAVALFKQEG